MGLKLAAMYIAAVIGAGFASGREIIQFFVQFGSTGLWGLGLATLLLCIGGASILLLTYQYQYNSYSTMLKSIGGGLSGYIDWCYTLFLLAGVSIMLAGSNETLQFLGIDQVGRYMTAVLVLIVLANGLSMVMEISSKVVPLLFLLLVAMATRIILTNGLVVPVETELNGIGAGVLYGGYNLGFAIAIFAGVGKQIKARREAVLGGVLGGLGLGLLLASLTFALWSAPADVLAEPIPMLVLATAWHPLAGWSYAALLWLAMYTTALANGLALTIRIHHQTTLSWRAGACLVVSLALVFSYLGFAMLIKMAYPLFGYFGLYLLYRVLRTSHDF